MQVDVNKVIQMYQEEVNRLLNENILLKAQLLQLEEEVRKNEGNVQG